MREILTKMSLRCLALGAGILTSACVTTGTRAIADPAVISHLEVNKSTKAEVRDLLGFPDAAAYPPGREIWEYFYQTITPKTYNYLPIIKIVNGFDQETRVLIITFNKEGLVKKIERQQTTGRAKNNNPPSQEVQ